MKLPNPFKFWVEWMRGQVLSSRYYNPPQKLWMPFNEVINVYMPLHDPNKISVKRTAQTVTVTAHEYPFEWYSSDKYNEQFLLSPQTKVLRVEYHSPNLKIFLGEAMSGDPYITHETYPVT